MITSMNVRLRYRKSSLQRASSLIMVIVLLSLMISVAITFMNLVGRHRGTAISVALQTYADMALQQGQAHTIRTYIESVDKILVPGKGVVDYSTAENVQWREQFTAVTDPDDDPFTNDGVGAEAGTSASPIYQTLWGVTPVSSNPLVNSDKKIVAMMGADITGKSHYFHQELFNFGNSISALSYLSRWYNVQYLTAQLKLIVIDDSLTEVEKGKLRRSAKYVVRYISKTLDLNATLSANNNFPMELDSGVHVGGSSANDQTHTIRYQNYLRCYGRSIKSMLSGRGFRTYQQRSFDLNFQARDVLDDEIVGTREDGALFGDLVAGGTHGSIRSDVRLRIERAFRGGDVQWMSANKPNSFLSVPSAGHKGRMMTWGHMTEVFLGQNPPAKLVFQFTPYADSMRDSELVNGGGISSEVSTPWRVNLLSASDVTLRSMILGLHSEMQFRPGNTIGEYAFSNSTADLFGKEYPEPFPLALDAGRNVPVIGRHIPTSTDSALNHKSAPSVVVYGDDPGNYTERVSEHWSFLDSGESSLSTRVAYRDSYLIDIAVAIDYAIRDARRAWIDEQELMSGPEENIATVTGSSTVYRYIGDVNNSFIKHAEKIPATMLKQVMREIYRILGEGEIIADSPNVSKNMYPSFGSGTALEKEKTLLAYGRTLVGVGSRAHYQRVAQLLKSEDTRAMEYVLNDVMISLFGKANPEFDEKNDPVSENIAIDFNGDGYAESTVTGWWDQGANGGAGIRKWSWWWDGLGPFVDATLVDKYMMKPGWYRFYDGDSVPKRRAGNEWVDVGNVADFRKYNDLWLNVNSLGSYPIKPFSKTGRLFIGKSKIFGGFVRSEVYDILHSTVAAAANRSFVYRVDPNGDDDYSDNILYIQSDKQFKGER